MGKGYLLLGLLINFLASYLLVISGFRILVHEFGHWFAGFPFSEICVIKKVPTGFSAICKNFRGNVFLFSIAGIVAELVFATVFLLTPYLNVVGFSWFFLIFYSLIEGAYDFDLKQAGLLFFKPFMILTLAFLLPIIAFYAVKSLEKYWN